MIFLLNMYELSNHGFDFFPLMMFIFSPQYKRTPIIHKTQNFLQCYYGSSRVPLNCKVDYYFQNRQMSLRIDRK